MMNGRWPKWEKKKEPSKLSGVVRCKKTWRFRLNKKVGEAGSVGVGRIKGGVVGGI